MSDKSRTATFLLAFFLGCFGAHRFYVGKTGSAVAQLLLFISVIGSFVTALWVLIDWIIILMGDFTDKDGFKITKW
jgi:TM2 domain-containing membrane protein YozV